MSGDLEAVDEMRRAFDRRGRTMHSMLSSLEGVTCIEPEGAFYCFPNLQGLLGRELAGRYLRDDARAGRPRLSAAKVAFVPGEAFGAPGYGRFSFALGDAAIVEGLTA